MLSSVVDLDRPCPFLALCTGVNRFAYPSPGSAGGSYVGENEMYGLRRALVFGFDGSIGAAFDGC